MACTFQWLVITDGTTSDAGIRNQVDLLSPAGFCLLEDGDWQPAITEPKGGGTWRDSALADGRIPSDFKAQNVSEAMTLTVTALNQDALIQDTQELRRLLGKARTYSTTNWQTEPVWIEAQGRGETNIRYAVIWDWRTPRDGNPYEQPFWQTLAAAGMDDFTLSLEREPYWRADMPGESTCVAITSSQEYDTAWFLEMDALTSRVFIPDDAVIQDLHAGDLTAEAWIRADGWGEGNAGKIFWKRDSSDVGGWYLGIDSTHGLVADGDYATNQAISRSGTDDFTPDGTWVHVAAVFAAFAINQWVLYVNGVQVSYTLQQGGTGALVTDVGDDLYIGNDINFAFTWEGDIGWARLSSSGRYGDNFTPPDRCSMPPIDVNTIGQWIGIENSGATIDNQEGTAAIDGTQTNCLFDACTRTYGRDVSTCLDEVYIANKHNLANITHIFTWSAANFFSANLVGTAPYGLIDIAGAAPAIDDYVVFIIDAALVDSGPFMSLVFDIGIAISGITLTTWEYSDGVPGWGALPNMQDNTNADGQMTGNIFDTTGVKSLHFDPAADFLPQIENGVNGYCVRARITAVPGPHVAPTQQLRDVYSIVWPYVEVASTEVLGDVTALLRLQAYNQCDHDGGATNLDASTSRFLISTRSVSRGSNFTSYLNLLAEQNPVGVTVTVLGVGAPVVNPDGPTGFHLSVPNPGAAWADVVHVAIDYPLSIEYNGRFRMLLRGDQITGAAGDIQFRVNALFAGAAIYNTSDAVSFTNVTNTFQVLDFGAITVPAQVGSVPSTSVQFEIQVFGDGVADARLYDLILMPVDEYAIDTNELFYTDASRVYGRGEPTERSYLDIDPITDPKQFATFVKQYANDRYTATWMNITPQNPVLQSNSRQRIWFLCWQYPTADDDPQDALPWMAHSIQMHKVQRYYSMRGSR